MDWNSRPSSLWEWDNFFELDNPKKLQQQQQQQQQTNYSFESLHSPGGSGSDLGSKSSVSACESKASTNNNNNNNMFAIGSSKEVSGEPLLSLKLGKRTYFKTPSPSATSSPASASAAAALLAKRSKSACRTGQAPRCQVEGCDLDLSSAKDYHKKHRICETHSKSPRVVVSGVERRFCQQCSRFHGLSEFDEKKRSCRRRLSDHNARRRKPQPEPVRLNPARFTSLYDEPQKMSLVFDQSPRLFTRHGSSFSWGLGGDDNGSKFGLTREYLSKPSSKSTTTTTVGSATQSQILLHNNDIPGNIPTLYPHGPTRATTNKNASPEFLHSGLEESVVAVGSELNATHDLHRALSLLSTSSWGSSSREAKTVSHDNNVAARPGLNPITQGLVVPLASSDLWLTEQNAIETQPATVSPLPRGNANTHFHDLHLFKPPSDSGFYSYQF